jgi:hypothetical protein
MQVEARAPLPASGPRPDPAFAVPAPAVPTGERIPGPPNSVLAVIVPPPPDPPPGATDTAPALDTLEAVSAYLSIETEMLRTTETDVAFAACVDRQIPKVVPAGGRSLPGQDLEPASLASQVYDACQSETAPASWDETSHAYMTVATFKALMAEFNTDGAAVVAYVLHSQVAFRLASERHLFRCIGEGFLAGVDSSSERPFVFRVLMTSIADHAVGTDPVVKLILSAVRAYCADEQFAVSQRRS